MSKIKYFAGLIFVLGLLFVVSCTKDEASLVSNSNLLQGQTLVIEAVREDNDSIGTRTIRQDDGSVYWNPGDEISLFFMSGKDGGYKFTSQNKEVAKVTQFTGTISGITGGGEDIADDAYFWAIYPYSSDNVCESGSLVTTLPCAQQAIEGTFADDLFITVARSQNVKMAFKNVCGGVKFTVSQAGIKSVVFKGNNGEPLAGKSRIIFDDNNIPVVSEVIDGQTEILVTAPNGGTFEVGKYYYIVAFPNALEGGFSMKFNKTDGTSGTYTRTSKVTIKRSTFGSVKNLDNGITFVEDDTNISAGSNETGIYLGIIGFNDRLHLYPINHLNNESVKAYNSFIDGLTMTDNTLLYYAVDNSISKLQKATYPDNLYDVSVVTFTDGYDEGSTDEPGVSYISRGEYAAAIQNRMENETVSGHKITAYSLGIESDETSTSSSAFQTHLRNLATSEDNTFLVKNMNELNAKFMDIADSLSETKYVQEFTFSMSSPDPGATIRFTFDNVSNPVNSKLYIQGTFAREGDNKEIRKLKDITYKGLTSKSTSTEVIGVRNLTDTKYSYTFKDIQSLDGELIDTSYAVIWRNEGTGWVSNINESSGVTGSDIEKVKRSAAIILNLDCSSSLKENFYVLQEIAKSFIARLIENSIDPNEVSSISLNKSSISLLKGDSDKITATVLPTTAYNKKIEWSSTNASVATVDADGVVTAVGPGNAKIIAKTVDGGYTVTCSVNVIALVESISIDQDELQIWNGESTVLAASVLPTNATNKDVNWSSSNKSVATVDNTGKITALSGGTTTITATAADGTGVAASCNVTVLQHVTSLSLSSKSLSMCTGESHTITTTVIPSNAANKNFTVASSDKTVATATKVDNSILIKSVGPGNATITAESEDGGFTASCSVDVKQILVGVEMNTTSEVLYVDDTKQLSATFTPSNATNKTLVWSSPNTDVATVDESGLVTAVSPGSATILATAQDGSGLVASCEVTVKQYVSSISLSKNSLTAYTGISETLSVNFLPSNASNKNFSVVSSDESIVKVTKSNQNITVQPIAPGNATITATSEDGEFTAICNVEVKQYVESIELSSTSETLYVGDSKQLTATVLPDNASDKSLKWESSNSNIVKVDENGLISALSSGTASIIATAQDGSGLAANCEVTVKQYVSSISLSETSLTAYTGTPETLSVNFLPTDASNKNFSVVSSDESIVKVAKSNQNVTVQPIAPGNATLTVTSEDGGFTATCNVEVKQYVESIELSSASEILSVGDSKQLTATVLPENASDKSLKWESSNSSIVQVDENGLITAISPGTATILALAQDGSGLVANCGITVKQHVSSVSLSSASVNLDLGRATTLSVSILPTNVTNSNYSVVSSNDNVATVSKNGKSITIKGTGVGSATITVTTEDGGYSSKCEVNVQFSQTPTHLALCVKKNNKRYYIPYDVYSIASLSGYTKEGITIVSGSTAFILALNNASSSALSFSDANNLGTLPNYTQANVISQNWSSIDNVITIYGGTSLGNISYWTSTQDSSGRAAYYYSASNVAYAAIQRNYYARKIIATL